MAFLTAVALMASPIIFRSEYLDDKPFTRPMETSLNGLSLAQINEFRRGQNTNLQTSDLCFVEAMRRESLVVLSRGGQEQLELLYSDVPEMRFDMSVKDGIRLTVGIYEKCRTMGQEARWGSLLIAMKSGKLIWAGEFENALPLYLYPSSGSHLAVLSSCMACGEATQLFYDSANQKFYTQYVGD